MSKTFRVTAFTCDLRTGPVRATYLSIFFRWWFYWHEWRAFPRQAFGDGMRRNPSGREPFFFGDPYFYSDYYDSHGSDYPAPPPVL
jgi:hypothetical protein